MIKYEDVEFYSIEEISGIKVVHIHGFIYDAGEGINDIDKTFRNVKLGGCYIPLSEFTSISYDTIVKFMNRCMENGPQNVTDLTKEDADWASRTYYPVKGGNHWPGKELLFSAVNGATPCGDYVNYKSAIKIYAA